MIYEIAGLRIDIQNRCPYTTEFCKEYLSSDQSSPAEFSVAVTDEQFYEEKAVSFAYADGYVENICIYRLICEKMPQYNRFLLHSAVLGVDGKGYAFLGKSGAGKTTHTGLWLSHVDGAYILNGDKPILEFDGENFYAHGTPWMGKEGLGRKGRLPVCGLCFIEQAKENRVEKLTIKELTSRLFSQVLVPTDEEGAIKTLALFDRFIKSVPAYVLYCDVSKEAVECSYFALTGKNID